MADPHTATVLTLDKIWAMCDELIDAHQRDGFLGAFQPVARNTGKPLSEVSRVFLSIQPEGMPFSSNSSNASVQLVAENETGETFSGEVEIEVAGVPAAIDPSGTLSLNLAAGECTKIPFTIQRQAAIDDDVQVSIRSRSLKTIERGFSLPKRTQIHVPGSVSGESRHPITVRWSGNPVAEGGVWMSNNELSIELRVNDTDPKFNEKASGQGSAIEIGLKDPVVSTAPLVVLVISPDSTAPKILFDGKPFDGGSVTVCADTTGYNMIAKVDLTKVNLSPSNPFLLDLIFHVNALGTAHGKVRAVWQGTSDWNRDQSRFALMIPTAH